MKDLTHENNADLDSKFEENADPDSKFEENAKMQNQIRGFRKFGSYQTPIRPPRDKIFKIL